MAKRTVQITKEQYEKLKKLMDEKDAFHRKIREGYAKKEETKTN